MARKTWVLDTDTKGTGAEMVPLEKVQERKRSATRKDEAPSLRLYRRKPRPAKETAPKPRQPRRFKVVDVMTRQVLAESVGAREALELLGDTRSTVDLRVYVWDAGEGDWRPLSLAEQKLLWERSVTTPE